MSDESPEKNTTVNQSGGITIEHADHVIVHGDMVAVTSIDAVAAERLAGRCACVGGVFCSAAGSWRFRFEKASDAEKVRRCV